MSEIILRQAQDTAELVYDYASIPDNSREVAMQVAVDIKPRLRRTAEDIFAIGRGLLRAKDALPHGFFSRWAYDELGLTSKSAQRFMLVAERLESESDNLSHLLPSVLYQLAQADTPSAAVGEVIRLNTQLRAQGERGATVAQTQEVIRRLRPSVPDIDDSEELPELRPAGASATVPLRRAGNETPQTTRRTGDSMAATHSTATCRACHRPLTDPASALAGIGPCCALREQMAGGSDGAGASTEPEASATGIDGNWQSLTEEMPVYSLSDDDVDIDDAPTHTAALTALQRNAARNLLRTIGYGINYFQPHPAAAEFGVEREWQAAWNAIQMLKTRLEAISQ